MELRDESAQTQNSQKVVKEIRKEIRLGSDLSQALTYRIIIILNQEDKEINQPSN
jgi:hypothetical protein